MHGTSKCDNPLCAYCHPPFENEPLIDQALVNSASVEPETDERSALAAIFEEAKVLHFRKREDYSSQGRDGGDHLGVKGQYAEIHRKMAKLHKGMWLGLPLLGEPLREVLLDVIGHCVKAIRYLDTKNDG